MPVFGEEHRSKLMAISERRSKMRYGSKPPSDAQIAKRFKLTRAALSALSAAVAPKNQEVARRLDALHGELIALERGL